MSFPDCPPERTIAQIGIVSDTHMPERCEQLPNKLFEVLDGVDMVLHAGDVGKLWVLDQLSQIAPVIAVHGNDETEEATRELPYQQLITLAGSYRIFLWHSHYPDQIDEWHARMDNTPRQSVKRSIMRGQRAGAQLVVFGHWHIPLVYESEGIIALNPGSFASGNGWTKLVKPTAVRLHLRDDLTPFIQHIDLTDGSSFAPTVQWDAPFRDTLNEWTESIILEKEGPLLRLWQKQIYNLAPRPIYEAALTVSRRCWREEQPHITLAEVAQACLADPFVPENVKTEIDLFITKHQIG